MIEIIGQKTFDEKAEFLNREIVRNSLGCKARNYETFIH